MTRPLTIAFRYLQAGLSVIPIRPDGTKSPACDSWKVYQSRPPKPWELRRWFQTDAPIGLAIIGGAVSGSLEILDFDDASVFGPWSNLVSDLLLGNLPRFPIVVTPSGGYHVYYRSPNIPGNMKLARRAEHGRAGAVRIETRGDGGYVVAPGSHPACHAMQRPYRRIAGSFTEIPLISPELRDTLLNSARLFDEYVEPPKPQAHRWSDEHEEKPGDHFNQTQTWHDVLEPFGWRAVAHHGDTIYWQRPDKSERGWSATTNHDGRDLLYVFSTNAHPFEANHGYRKFTAWTLLRFGGDFHAAAQALTHGKVRA